MKKPEKKGPTLFEKVKAATGLIVDVVVIIGAIQTVIRYVVFH